MIKNYITITIRNLRRNKTFSCINIVGLAIGMAGAILIMLWMQHEIGYDGFHEKKDRIYQAWNKANMNGEIWTFNNTPKVLARTLEKDFPEIELATKAEIPQPHMLKAGQKRITASGRIADSNFLKVFSFPLITGDKHTALNDVHSIVITQTLSKKLFGNDNAIGELITIDNKDNLIVTGILKDIPGNTQFPFEYLLSYSYLVSMGRDDNDWGNNTIQTYVLLRPEANVVTLNEKMKNLKPRYYPYDPKWEMFVYPISRWRLYSNFKNGIEENKGIIEYVRLFGIISALILIIACINFMNLSTARGEERAKEVGIRKVVGAKKSSLILQFLGESIFLSFFSAIIAIVIVALTLPFFNQLMDEKIIFNLADPETITAFLGFTLFTGIIAGSYPAFFLSSFQPAKVLKGIFKKSHARISPRKVLVIIQFTTAIILIISTIIIRQQIDHLQKREIGYDKNNIVYHQFTGDIPKNYELIRNELLSSGVATSITKTMSPLSETRSEGHGQAWEGKDPNDKTIFNRYSQDANLGTTAGLQFLYGRDIDVRKFPTDSNALIINESALKVFKFKEPIGKTINDMGIDWHIVGVIKDFIINYPQQPTEPMLILGAKSIFSFNTILMKFNHQNNMSDNLEKSSAIFRKYNPDFPFEYKFADEEYEKKLEGVKRISTLTGIFAMLTIFIACLGLLGLAAYTTQSRIKEIGVRKVLGGSIITITSLLTKDFLTLVCISFLLAIPIAWWGMNIWLNDFHYHTSIDWSVFVIAGLLAMSIALITVSSQAIKAAMANPIKNLRTE